MSTNLTVTFIANHILFNDLTKYIAYYLDRCYEDEEVYKQIVGYTI